MSFNRYTFQGQQYLNNTTAPAYILVGKSHLYDIYFVKQLAIAQLLHGNGTHLLAMQAKITNQHSSTPDIQNTMEGTKVLTPSNLADNIAFNTLSSTIQYISHRMEYRKYYSSSTTYTSKL